MLLLFHRDTACLSTTGQHSVGRCLASDRLSGMDQPTYITYRHTHTLEILHTSQNSAVTYWVATCGMKNTVQPRISTNSNPSGVFGATVNAPSSSPVSFLSPFLQLSPNFAHFLEPPLLDDFLPSSLLVLSTSNTDHSRVLKVASCLVLLCMQFSLPSNPCHLHTPITRR